MDQIEIHVLETVTGGKNPNPTPTPRGGDGESIVRLDRRFPPLEDQFKGRTKGQG